MTQCCVPIPRFVKQIAVRPTDDIVIMTTMDQQIEAKLQGVAASWRRERDEAHRQKQLALERLRLAQEEVEATEKSTMALVHKLHELKSECGEKAEQGNGQLKREVEEGTERVSLLVARDFAR